MISSICIPRLESNISKDYIFQTLQKLKVGYIKHIAEIPLRNDPTHKRIIIKIEWNTAQKSIDFQQKLANIGSVKLVHNMPWYWKIVTTNPQI
jgi:hypothetical protein